MRKREIIMLICFVLQYTMLSAQLQTTTDNGNTTNNLIQITGFGKIPTSGSGMELYGGDRAVLQGLNRNTGTGIPLSLNPTNANIHMVENGGNVGIGTTSPQYKLHIGAGNNDGILIGNYNDGFGWDGTGVQPGYHIRFAGFRDVVPNITGARISALRTNRCCAGLYTGMDLAFYTTAYVGQTGDGNLSEAMRIKDNGDVGIGTDMPSAKLHVSSGGTSASSVLIKIGGIGETPNTMAGVLLGGAGIVNDRYKGGMVFTPDVTNYGKGSLRFLVNNEMSDASATLADTRMCIASSGNVGIGTITPSEVLHVQGQKVGLRFNPDFQGAAYIYAYAENAYQPLTLQASKFTIATNGNENFVVNATGNVGVGTVSPTEKLSVNGNIRSRKVIVTQTGWPDYVFDSSYQLPSLDSVSTFIQANKHLPDMPSAATVEKDGHDLGEVQKMLLKKVEELTLYVIELQKQNEVLKTTYERLNKDNQQIKQLNNQLIQYINQTQKTKP